MEEFGIVGELHQSKGPKEERMEDMARTERRIAKKNVETPGS